MLFTNYFISGRNIFIGYMNNCFLYKSSIHINYDKNIYNVCVYNSFYISMSHFISLFYVLNNTKKMIQFFFKY